MTGKQNMMRLRRVNTWKIPYYHKINISIFLNKMKAILYIKEKNFRYRHSLMKLLIH
jgi:hypothetical protein